jgi:hypothetical protein
VELYIVTSLINGFFETTQIYTKKDSATARFQAERQTILRSLEEDERIDEDTTNEFIVYKGHHVSYQLVLTTRSLHNQ